MIRNEMKLKRLLIFYASLIIISILTWHFYLAYFSTVKKSKFDYVRTRDFIRWDCQRIMRVGGQAEYRANAPNELYRIDGAWFVCLDDELAPQKNNCNIFSFGVNHDYSFEDDITHNFGYISLFI